MPSTFSGIETSNRALRMNQVVIDVTGHNIANVDTEGYSRQMVAVSSTDPISLAGDGANMYQLGTGVEASAIHRAQDKFLTARILQNASDQARADSLNSTLEKVQSVYGEKTATGISSLMSAFFNSFQSLSQNAESASTRSTVIQSAKVLSQQFNSVSNSLDTLTNDLQSQIDTVIGQANSLATQVANLNKQIAATNGANDHPNDLLDKRDELIRQLGTLVGINVNADTGQNNEPNGMLNITAGGFAVVQGTSVYNLPTQTKNVNGQAYLVDSFRDIPLKGGQVDGLVEGKGKIASYQSDLNAVASTLINEVNVRHQAGYGLDGLTGRVFFTGVDAAGISVSPAIENNPSAIAASVAPVTGQDVALSNGDNALAIADIATTPVSGIYAIGDRYASSISRIGAEAKSYIQESQTQSIMNQQLQSLRGSVSGVSLDDELTTMMQYQRSYQAAAKMLTTMDAMIQNIIEMVR